MPEWRSGGIRWLWLTAASLILDQITKVWVASQFRLYESIALAPFFNLVYVRNEGAAFSFLSSAGGWQRWFFAGIAITVSVVLLVMLMKTSRSHKLLNAAYALVIGGAIGNLIDRLAYGYVIDFLDFYIDTWHWPAFNVADISISLGAGLLILDTLMQSPARTTQE